MVVLWKKAFNCPVTSYASNFIDIEVKYDNLGIWRLMGFYGFPDICRRRDSYNSLRRLAAGSNLPWCIVGNFNDLLNLEDKYGLVEHPQWLYDGF